MNEMHMKLFCARRLVRSYVGGMRVGAPPKSAMLAY